jgi:hypothetical protein
MSHSIFEYALPIYAFGLTYAQKLVADLGDARLCDQPVPGRAMNHAAFTLGHLAWVSEAGGNLLNAPSLGMPDRKELFGMGSQPSSDRSIYPTKAELLGWLEAGHARLVEAVFETKAEVFTQPAPERMRARFPTMGSLILGLMTSHEATHLGQLSAWRRALGLPAVF